MQHVHMQQAVQAGQRIIDGINRAMGPGSREAIARMLETVRTMAARTHMQEAR